MEHIKDQILSISTARKILSPLTPKKGHDVDSSPSQQEYWLRKKQTQTMGLTLNFQSRGAAVFTRKPSSCWCLLSFSCSQLLLAVQLSSSDARLCRFITKQQPAHEKKKSHPDINSTFKNRKAAWICSGRAKNKGFWLQL